MSCANKRVTRSRVASCGSKAERLAQLGDRVSDVQQYNPNAQICATESGLDADVRCVHCTLTSFPVARQEAFVRSLQILHIFASRHPSGGGGPRRYRSETERTMHKSTRCVHFIHSKLFNQFRDDADKRSSSGWKTRSAVLDSEQHLLLHHNKTQA